VCGLCVEGGRCDLVPDAIYFPPVARTRNNRRCHQEKMIIRSLREMPPGWQLARQRWDCGCVYHLYLGTGVLLLDYSGQDLFVTPII